MKIHNFDNDQITDPYYKMSNEEIAHLLSQRVYNPCTTYGDFALQLFIEKVVLPKDCDGYTDKDMKKYILEFLDKNNTGKDG